MNVADYAKSALYIAQYHYLHGGGNLSLAQKYLEQLSASNSEDVNTAQELLKQVVAAIQVKGGQTKAKGVGSVTAAGTDVEDVSMES
jgi:anaphase-promoting complex subunit 8